MGNAQSSEQPRRAQKLSKPRVGNHASNNNLLSPNASSPNVGARYSNSYLVGPPPVPSPVPSNDSPDTIHAITTDEVEPHAASTSTSSKENVPVEKPQRRSGLFRSPTSPQLDESARRKSAGLSIAETFDGLRRPKSVVQQRDEVSPLSSGTASGSQANRRASHHDFKFYQDSNPARTSLENATNASPTLPTAQTNIQEAPELSRRDSWLQQQAIGAPQSQVQSPTSLYATTRRRSFLQTPGVATRPEPLSAPPSKKSSFRKSLPADASSSRRTSEDSIVRRQSMPLSPSMIEIPDRVSLRTPSDNDYKQLGVMKFGSLHITNGTPTSTPGPEPDATDADGDDISSPAELKLPSEAVEDIMQPKPLSGAVSPIVAKFSDSQPDRPILGIDNQSSLMPSPSAGWKADTETSPFSAGTQSSTQDAPDIWDVRQDPQAMGSANTTPEDVSQKSSSSVHRSDSGFGSNSSSESSQEHLPSRGDSGYGSSISLKSFFGSKRALKQSNEAGTSNTKAATREARPTLKHHSPYSSQAKDTPQIATSETKLSQPATEEKPRANTERSHSISRGSNLLGSFKARKAREAATAKTAHSRGSSVPEIVVKEVTAGNTPPTSESMVKPKKLQKLINNTRRRSLPSMLPGRNQTDAIPSLPVDAEQKVQEHHRNFQAETKRHSFRALPKKEAPNTILGVEDREVERPRTVDHRTRTDKGTLDPLEPRPLLPRSKSAVSSKAPAHHKSILRKSSSLQPGPEVWDDDTASDHILGFEAQAASIDSIRRSAGHSAFDAAFVPMTEDNALHAVIQTERRKQPAGPGQASSNGRGPYPRLRNRRSAPDFLETVSEPASPGTISCYDQKKPKTPPPISIRTRGSKKKRRPRSAQPPPHHSQHPPMPPLYHHDPVRGGFPLEQDLSLSLRSIPVSQPHGSMAPRHTGSAQNPPGQRTTSGRRPIVRPLYPSQAQGLDADAGRYPPLPRTSPAGSSATDAETTPYRVLHSYNSPAYKGVPIWS